MTKQLTPLRRKDQATGYQAAVRDIVEWLREEQAATEQLRDEMDSKTEGWRYADEHASAIEQSANAIEDKFGKANETRD